MPFAVGHFRVPLGLGALAEGGAVGEAQPGRRRGAGSFRLRGVRDHALLRARAKRDHHHRPRTPPRAGGRLRRRPAQTGGRIVRGLSEADEETMAHQDYQISQLVERLKAEGEWENTLLIIASDHGHPAATFSRFGRALEDPPPEEWEGAILGSFKTWIPLMFIWPGHIAGGQRFSQHVSMIDMLPTVLDLTDLPLPEGLQGQSLAPLLLGKKGWEQKPVNYDEIYVDTKTGNLLGNIEVIDGQWGASLEIALGPDGKELFTYRRYQAPASGRWIYPPHDFPNIPRVLVYDLRNDPHALSNINEERPDLVDKYTKFLKNKWKEHQALAKNFSQSQKGSLTKEQIETLRSLGYIR